MTQAEFIQYHNRHIKFGETNNQEEYKSGVLLDIATPHRIVGDNEYVFIPSGKMMEWEKARKDKDAITLGKLEKIKFDISLIKWAVILN